MAVAISRRAAGNCTGTADHYTVKKDQLQSIGADGSRHKALADGYEIKNEG